MNSYEGAILEKGSSSFGNGWHDHLLDRLYTISIQFNKYLLSIIYIQGSVSNMLPCPWTLTVSKHFYILWFLLWVFWQTTLVSEILLEHEIQRLSEDTYHTGYIWHVDKEGQHKWTDGGLTEWLHKSLSENWGLGIPAVYLFLLQLRFLILTRKQVGVIAKTNSWDSRDATSNLVLVNCDSVSM